MTAYKWSKTAASNGNIDSTINAREGMAPSQINDSLRAIMAALAKWRDDLSGNLVTGGTSTAYTVTTNQAYDALTDGISVRARLSATNGENPTLNVDGLGAKSIAGVYGTAVATGRLLSGGVYTFTYDSTDDKWIVDGERGVTGTLAVANGGTGQTSEAAAFNALKQGATESATGVVEMATTSESETGTDTSRAVTPAGLKSHVDARIATQSDMESASSNTLFVTPGRARFNPGVAKAWVTFRGTGTAAILEDYGITSLTDNAAGLYTVSFDVAFSNTTYAASAWAKYNGGAAAALVGGNNSSNKATTAFQTYTADSTSGSATDALEVCLIFMGDQA